MEIAATLSEFMTYRTKIPTYGKEKRAGEAGACGDQDVLVSSGSKAIAKPFAMVTQSIHLSIREVGGIKFSAEAPFDAANTKHFTVMNKFPCFYSFGPNIIAQREIFFDLFSIHAAINAERMNIQRIFLGHIRLFLRIRAEKQNTLCDLFKFLKNLAAMLRVYMLLELHIEGELPLVAEG